MRSAIFALDPGNTYSGLAAADVNATTARDAMLAIERVRTARMSPYLAAHKILRPMAKLLVRRLDLTVVGVAVELAPFTVKDDAPGASGRGAIGYQQGWLAASFCGAPGDFVPEGEEPLQVGSAEWRKTMLSVLGEAKPTRAGVVRNAQALAARNAKLTLTRRGADIVLTWEGCDHESTRKASTFLSDLAPSSCPHCAGKPPGDPAVLLRDKWKEIAVLGALSLWPSLMEPVIGQARASSTREKAGRPPSPWHLDGVPDAAEAAWCAFHVVAQRNPVVCVRVPDRRRSS